MRPSAMAPAVSRAAARSPHAGQGKGGGPEPVGAGVLLRLVHRPGVFDGAGECVGGDGVGGGCCGRNHARQADDAVARFVDGLGVLHRRRVVAVPDLDRDQGHVDRPPRHRIGDLGQHGQRALGTPGLAICRGRRGKGVSRATPSADRAASSAASRISTAAPGRIGPRPAPNSASRPAAVARSRPAASAATSLAAEAMPASSPARARATAMAASACPRAAGSGMRSLAAAATVVSPVSARPMTMSRRALMMRRASRMRPATSNASRVMPARA